MLQDGTKHSDSHNPERQWKREDRDLLDDFAMAVADFDAVDCSPVNTAIGKARAAMAEAVELAREVEQKAAYWTQRVHACVELDKITNKDTRRRAAALVARDFADPDTALDFLTCPPLDGISLLSLSDGGHLPSNAYEAFASRLRGGRAEELELAETGGPIERYTYRLRILRGLGESRSKVFEWRKLGKSCGLRLIQEAKPTGAIKPPVKTIPFAPQGVDVMSGGNHDDEISRYRVGRSRDRPGVMGSNRGARSVTG